MEDAVEDPVDSVCRDEVVQMLNENKKSPCTFRNTIVVNC